MKLLVLSIKPESGFGTQLKGDTLFGHFCWQAAHDPSLLSDDLGKWTALYGERPFAIVSSAYPKFYDGKTWYALKRPYLPFLFLVKNIFDADKKEFKKRRWMLVEEDLRLDLSSAKLLTEEELEDMVCKGATKDKIRTMAGLRRRFIAEAEQTHNTIDRLTGTTGEGMFAPYSETLHYFYPETELAIFILFDEEATDADRICGAFERIGRWGFGKDASTGHGQFGLAECEELTLPDAGSANACYTLGPTVPEKGIFHEYFFTPFIRFGKHGDMLARSANPFKNPVIMADEGGIFIPEDRDVFKKPYIGRAVTGVSKAMPESVSQGYSIYIPFRMEI